MEDEHRESQPTQISHHLRPEEARDRRRVRRQAVAVHGRQELRVQRHEQRRPHHRVVEVELRQPQEQSRVGRDEVVDRVHCLLLPLLGCVQHHLAHRHDAHRHLDQGPEGVEARQVPDQRVGVLLRHVVHVEPRGLGEGDLLQQRHRRQRAEHLLQSVLRKLRDSGKDGRHRQVRESQRRQKPGGLVPDLGLLREPRLEHRETEESTIEGRRPWRLEPPLHLHKHGSEDGERDEMQGVVAHDLLPEEQLRLCKLLLVSGTLPELRRRVGGYITADHKEATYENVLLREDLQRRLVARAKASEVRDDDGHHQCEATPVDAIDPRLARPLRLRNDLGRRCLRYSGITFAHGAERQN
mmetsp:Transcript_93379/g.269700  ORF Transcript_93379/g.269700 Transcript_93379/m.269700 type:complete len:354 (+) Transcript_93379:381-1442(+)